MSKKAWCTLLVLMIPAWFNAFGREEDVLWPELEPYKTGYLKVSDLHEIFYQLGGNPEGKPVMVLHGGPGASCHPFFFRFFNPDAFHIILHDQRGAGKSKPYAELKENTTRHLVEDMEKLRQHLSLGKVILFGGSWGSTLALAYGEQYPKHVSGMILRGIFTATRAEVDHFYHGGAAKFFPENYERLLQQIDRPKEKNYPEQLLVKMQSPEAAVQETCARAWARYECKMCTIEYPDSHIEALLKNRERYFAFSLFENHYMTNRCFLGEEELWKNAGKLKGIPITLINGRYDVICPPITAYKLHKKLPGSKLVIVERAGHSPGDEPLEAALVREVRFFK